MEVEWKIEFVVFCIFIEIVIVKIIIEVLGVERVGINDNFLVLGGYFFLVIKVIYWLWEKLGVDLFVRSLFEFFIVVELVEIIVKSE